MRPRHDLQIVGHPSYGNTSFWRMWAPMRDCATKLKPLDIQGNGDIHQYFRCMSNLSALQRSPDLTLYRFLPGTYCAFPNEETGPLSQPFLHSGTYYAFPNEEMVAIVDSTLPKEHSDGQSESVGLSNSGQTGLHAVPAQWIKKS